MRRRNAGFTLLELMIAIAVFGLMATVAYGGLKSVLALTTATELQAQRIGEIQLAVSRLERDVEQAIARGVRNELGERGPALAGGVGFDALELTRDGRPNPLNRQRSSLQRVAWRVLGEELVRQAMPVLDQPLGLESTDFEVVLTGVEELQMQFLDSEDQWVLQWPKGPEPELQEVIPRAVDLRLQLNDWGEIRRILVLPGGESRDGAT